MSDAVERPAGRRLTPWRVALTLAMTGALVALFLTQVSFTRIVDMIRGADKGYLGLATLAYMASYVARALRWQMLTPSVTIPFGPLLGITAVHNFMVRVLPAKLGETIYPVLMKTRGVPGTEALAGLLIARIYDMAAAIVFFVVSLFLTQTQFQGSLAANLAVAGVILAISIVALLRGSRFVRIVSLVAARLAALPWVPAFFLGHGVRRRLDRLEAMLEKMQSARQVPLLLATTVLVWLPSFVMVWWLLIAFGAPFAFWGTVFVSTLSIVATLLPIGTVGNFGTQEAGWTFAMVMLGVDRETAIATGFSTHLVSFSLAGLFGLVGAWLSGLTRTGRRAS